MLHGLQKYTKQPNHELLPVSTRAYWPKHTIGPSSHPDVLNNPSTPDFDELISTVVLLINSDRGTQTIYNLA
ncbi:hypothetical protein INT45_009397 [Circinella minor]|uniref:Uncharacterized protein n=1 Tax=Circinella minor TaxID=1195481 RepID=A0A8H7S6Z3_9FUNG|nr:hypothetical protein INT45_009397 [Circinella minor]